MRRTNESWRHTLRDTAKIKIDCDAVKLIDVNDNGSGAGRSAISRAYRKKGPSMPTHVPQMSITLVPPPGTTEALEVGCTCQLIAHESVTQEREPAGMLIDPDPNCPLHGTGRDGSSTILI
jgi:hypothetical protein